MQRLLIDSESGANVWNISKSIKRSSPYAFVDYTLSFLHLCVHVSTSNYRIFNTQHDRIVVQMAIGRWSRIDVLSSFYEHFQRRMGRWSPMESIAFVSEYVYVLFNVVRSISTISLARIDAWKLRSFMESRLTPPVSPTMSLLSKILNVQNNVWYVYRMFLYKRDRELFLLEWTKLGCI